MHDELEDKMMNPNQSNQQNQITLTKDAQLYIQKVLAKEEGIGLRLTIKKTGCSGYSYLPQVIKEIDPKDTQIDFDDVKLFVDSKWLHLLNGIKIDYLEEEKLGLRQKRLIFTNPNEKSRCGCGESFHVDNV